MQIKQYIVKYLLIVVGLATIRLLLHFLVPDLFTKTIEGDGFTQTKITFFSLYQLNFFNLIISGIMAIDLRKNGQNWIVVPILTTISLTSGLFLFSILTLHNLLYRNEKI